jgi:hypothetical protein
MFSKMQNVFNKFLRTCISQMRLLIMLLISELKYFSWARRAWSVEWLPMGWVVMVPISDCGEGRGGGSLHHNAQISTGPPTFLPNAYRVYFLVVSGWSIKMTTHFHLLTELMMMMSMRWDLPTGLLIIPQVIYEHEEPWWNDINTGK